MGMLILETCRG